MDVDGVGLAAGRATGVVARIRLVGVLDLQLTVRPAPLVRFDFDSGTFRLVVQQHVVMEPKDVIRRNRTLCKSRSIIT